MLDAAASTDSPCPQDRLGYNGLWNAWLCRKTRRSSASPPAVLLRSSRFVPTNAEIVGLPDASFGTGAMISQGGVYQLVLRTHNMHPQFPHGSPRCPPSVVSISAGSMGLGCVCVFRVHLRLDNRHHRARDHGVAVAALRDGWPVTSAAAAAAAAAVLVLLLVLLVLLHRLSLTLHRRFDPSPPFLGFSTAFRCLSHGEHFVFEPPVKSRAGGVAVAVDDSCLGRWQL